MAAVAAVLAMPVGAATADTVINGSVEFYDSTGEASFNISILNANLDYSLPPGDSYFVIQAYFSLYDSNGNLITPEPHLYGEPSDQAQYIGDTYTGYLGPLPDYGVSYGDLPIGYYTVDGSGSITVCEDCSPTYELTGDITPTPVPATLPLFATGVGALGLFGWRKKRKQR